MQTDGKKVTTSLTQLLTGKATITTSLTRYIWQWHGHYGPYLPLPDIRPAPQEEMCDWYCKSGQEPMAGDLMDPRGELTTVILLNGHNIKLTSASQCAGSRCYCFSTLSALTGETSLCGGQWLTQKVTAGHRAENTWLWSTQPHYCAKGLENIKEEGQKDSKTPERTGLKFWTF